MRIDRVTLRLVRLPLVRPFQTSSSRKEHLDHILVQVDSGDGITGWGECASPSDPFYCRETTETCWHIAARFPGPHDPGARVDDDRASLPACTPRSKATPSPAPESRWPAGMRSARSSQNRCMRLLGGTRREILSGVSLGIEPNIDTLC